MMKVFGIYDLKIVCLHYDAYISSWVNPYHLLFSPCSARSCPARHVRSTNQTVLTF